MEEIDFTSLYIDTMNQISQPQHYEVLLGNAPDLGELWGIENLPSQLWGDKYTIYVINDKYDVGVEFEDEYKAVTLLTYLVKELSLMCNTYFQHGSYHLSFCNLSTEQLLKVLGFNPMNLHDS